jgi:tail tube protein
MGFGRNSFVGWAQESTWGTVQTPSKYAEIKGDGIKGFRNREPRPVFRDLDAREGQLYDAFFGVEGGFTIEGNYIGMLRLLEHLFGDSSDTITQPDVGVRWLHTYRLSDTPMVGKGLSVHLNTDTDNASTPQKRCTGFKLSKGTFVYVPDNNLEVQIEGAGKDVDLVAASTPTFPSITEYIAGHQTTVEFDDVVRAVDRVEITVDQSLDLKKRVLGSKFIAEPVHGPDRRIVTGVIDVDAAQADFSKLLAGTLFKLEVISLGATLGTGTFQFYWTFNKCLVLEDPYKVNDPGLVKSRISFRALKPISGDLVTLIVGNNESAVA